jgi:hypothetical protein
MSASIKAGLNNDMHLMTDGVTRAYVDGNGKVGIGTDSPTSGLHVQTDTNPVMKVSRGTNNAANINLYYNTTFTGQVSGSAGAFQLSSVGSSTPMQFYTDGSKNMEIDENGYVTTPNQPSFMAVGSSATPSSGSGWPWGSIIHNNGSHFSLATGRFTAPVAGKYMFFATFIGSNSNDVYRYYTRKNNVNYPRPNSQLRLDTAGSSGTDYEYGTSAILMDMAAGDYAAIWFESGGTNSHPGGTNTTSGHEIFSGYLIG